MLSLLHCELIRVLFTLYQLYRCIQASNKIHLASNSSKGTSSSGLLQVDLSTLASTRADTQTNRGAPTPELVPALTRFCKTILDKFLGTSLNSSSLHKKTEPMAKMCQSADKRTSTLRSQGSEAGEGGECRIENGALELPYALCHAQPLPLGRPPHHSSRRARLR